MGSTIYKRLKYSHIDDVIIYFFNEIKLAILCLYLHRWNLISNFIVIKGPVEDSNQLFIFIYAVLFIFIGSLFFMDLLIGVMFMNYHEA